MDLRPSALYSLFLLSNPGDRVQCHRGSCRPRRSPARLHQPREHPVRRTVAGCSRHATVHHSFFLFPLLLPLMPWHSSLFLFLLCYTGATTPVPATSTKPPHRPPSARSTTIIGALPGSASARASSAGGRVSPRLAPPATTTAATATTLSSSTTSSSTTTVPAASASVYRHAQPSLPVPSFTPIAGAGPLMPSRPIAVACTPSAGATPLSSASALVVRHSTVVPTPGRASAMGSTPARPAAHYAPTPAAPSTERRTHPPGATPTPLPASGTTRAGAASTTARRAGTGSLAATPTSAQRRVSPSPMPPPAPHLAAIAPTPPSGTSRPPSRPQHGLSPPPHPPAAEMVDGEGGRDGNDGGGSSAEGIVTSALSPMETTTVVGGEALLDTRGQPKFPAGTALPWVHYNTP